jgi:hypothetical protein
MIWRRTRKMRRGIIGITTQAVSLGGAILLASYIYRVSQEERTKLWESVPYVKLYRYNPKHLYPKLNGYGDNAQRKVWSSCGSMYCMWLA